ncbi:toll/interleukin-1 receptor domain-containing protein [Winogradskyella haliclonae]|uniref:TIR domain-containing protein n=1 Tax=Winogradskyella haliclonae TaxID=2048558 RepID=A0ABQ2C273_9FLAO|nr:toll/interleukin-1 receptor domain-containing protein [Winogradskyella haliclonae]GGI58479.1 hypothetical protein GCM10011444_27880 [Winogradskyella haliclonae]
MSKFYWNIDANNIDIGDIDVKYLDKYILVTKEIKEFLDNSSDNKKLFLVAPKGLGKTLVLKAKSQLYREKSGYKFIPDDKLTEKLSKVGFSITKEDLNKFKSREQWDKIWEFCILCLILRRFKIGLPEEINSYIGNAGELGEILTAVLQNRGAIDKIYKYVNTDLRPKVRNLPDEGINQIAIFIDNIDEGFEQHTGESLRIPDLKSSVLSHKVWINAQISIVQIARNLCNSFQHLKIFVSIRSEAYVNNKDATRLQLDDYSTFLNYSKSDLKKIFLLNINATPPERLCKSDIQFNRLTGFGMIEHSFIEDVNGDRKQEDLFSFIYRHTYGRPREIVEMGTKILKLEPDERTPANVHRVVNEVGHRLFTYLKNEIVPYFEEDVFWELCKLSKKNVITFEDATKIYNKIKSDYSFDNVFSYFYRLGLIGYVDLNHQSVMTQKFLPVGQYSLSAAPIPEYKYFLIHATLNEEMKKFHQNDFYDSYNIIGDGYPFIVNDKSSRCKHVHIGLNRDCVTLLIPELYKHKFLGIIQTPKQEWSDFNDVDKVVFEYSSGETLKLDIYRDNQSVPKKEKVLKEYFENSNSVLFYTEDKEVINKVIMYSEVLSFGYYPQNIFDNYTSKNDLTDKLVYYSKRFISKSELAKISKNLSMPTSKCMPTLTDRFLLSPIENLKSKNILRLKLNVENYGLIIAPTGKNVTLKPSRTVIRTKSNDEYQFYRLRQDYLVEGIYQFFKYSKQSGKELFHKDGNPKKILELFINIQALRVLRAQSPKRRLRFLDKTENRLFEELVQFGEKSLSRAVALAKQYRFTGTVAILKTLKSKGVIPSKSNFYSIITNSKYLDSYEEIIKLIDFLDIQPLRKKYKSVFISYSFKDSSFAMLLYSFLRLNGIDVFLFEIDDPHKNLKRVMADEVAERDMLVFIASKNSLRSEACQFELSNCRAKYDKTWEKSIIPVRIDDYILKLKKHSIPQKNRKEYWSNIKMIKDNNITDYSEFIETIDYQLFQNDKVKKLINDNLIIDTLK